MSSLPPVPPTAPEQPPAPPTGPRRRIRFRTIVLAVCAGGMLWSVAVWPPPLYYRWFWPRETAFMAMRAGEGDSLGRHAQRRREVVEGRLPRLYRPVPSRQMAPALERAVLVAEDHRFREHGGIDYRAVRTALGYRRDVFDWRDGRDRDDMLRVVSRAWSRRSQIRGASTITQQLAKNLYLSPSRNPLRKAKEALTAYRLEWALDKDRILELYLNVVEFGPEIWGVEAASRHYFNKGAARLTEAEAAALAGSLPFPLRSNPGFRPGRMRWRQQWILRRLRGQWIEAPADSSADDGPPVSR